MIVVFGSLNVDLIVPVERLPHAGETVLGPSYTFAAGGKGGNQATELHASPKLPKSASLHAPGGSSQSLL